MHAVSNIVCHRMCEAKTGWGRIGGEEENPCAYGKIILNNNRKKIIKLFNGKQKKMLHKRNDNFILIIVESHIVILGNVRKKSILYQQDLEDLIIINNLFLFVIYEMLCSLLKSNHYF